MKKEENTESSAVMAYNPSTDEKEDETYTCHQCGDYFDDEE